ncbi:MAG: tRNA (adenosine(37)-N6)-threonylcarbamoyltransferase complex dimerization subunit type 1 TsaB [Saprospiraceae bacterium]
MAYILNIETATDICSVAIAENDTLLSLAETTESFQHAAQLTHLIDTCLQDTTLKMKDLDAVAVSQGPGSYTALRVGTSTAKGIAYALQLPLIAVDTLQSLAHAGSEIYHRDILYCPMIDARRMEVYAAIYNFQNMAVTETQAIIVDENSFSSYFASDNSIVFIGNGAEKCRSVIHSPLAIFHPLKCSAKYLVKLAYQAFQNNLFQDVAYYAPQYFKAPNITTPKKIL